MNTRFQRERFYSFFYEVQAGGSSVGNAGPQAEKVGGG